VATLGWELEEERQRSATTSASQWGDTSGRSRYARWDRAYYAYLSGQGGAAAFNIGARLEDNERFGALGTWQAGVTWRPLGAAGPRLSGSAGVGIKEPTFYENYATGFARGNPDLSPERSRSWEVGLDETLTGGALTVRASYFSQRFQDLIQYTATTPTPDAPNFFNVARAAASGVELEGAAHEGPFGARASWTWLRTRVLNAGLDAGQGPGAEFVDGERLLRRPANMATLGASYDAGGRASVTAELRIVGTRDGRDFRSYPATRVVLPRYENLSAGGEVRLWEPEADRPGLSLTLRGENLLNQSYQEIVGFPAPGRELFIGGRVTLGS
jgi:vitamin B12 transporter